MIVRKAAENVALTAADLAEITDSQPLYLTQDDLTDTLSPEDIAKAAFEVEAAKATALGKAIGEAMQKALMPMIERMDRIEKRVEPKVATAKRIEKDVVYGETGKDKGRILKVIETHTEE